MKRMKKYRLKKHIKQKLLIVSVVGISLLLIKIGLNNYNNLARECDAYYNTTCSHYDINIYKNNK